MQQCHKLVDIQLTYKTAFLQIWNQWTVDYAITNKHFKALLIGLQLALISKT